MPGRSVDDEAVTAVVLTNQAAGNVQRFQLQTEPAHVDSQLFGLVVARSPAKANDLAGAEEAVDGGFGRLATGKRSNGAPRQELRPPHPQDGQGIIARRDYFRGEVAS
jgi:hypothetical protein